MNWKQSEKNDKLCVCVCKTFLDSNTDDSKNHKISNDENNNNNTYDDKIDEDLVDLEDRNVQGTYMEDRIIIRRQDDERTL